MIKVDLLTGFLGSGKTTFIRKYVEHLSKSNIKIGIIENDFGAINIDMMMLQDLESDQCELEPIVGGNVESDWKRRFKAKLISMAMQGFDRVIVEPSGIYDVDVFFDELYEEPLDRWYEVGNVFALVDAKLDERLSEQAEYLLVSQVANAGKVILSKAQDATVEEQEHTIARINEILGKYDCKRRFCPASGNGDGTKADHIDLESTIINTSDIILARDWDSLTPADYEELLHCGHVNADHKKLWFDKNEMFTSLFFMDMDITADQLHQAVEQMMQDEDCGIVFRMKGFVQQEDNTWMTINATHDHICMEPIERGQSVLIVIGQDLVEENIRRYLDIDK